MSRYGFSVCDASLEWRPCPGEAPTGTLVELALDAEGFSVPVGNGDDQEPQTRQVLREESPPPGQWHSGRRSAAGQADWTPDGRLISIKGALNRLARVEWRWIDGGMFGEEVTRAEAEFRPGPEPSIGAVLTAYCKRKEATDPAVRVMSLTERCRGWGGRGKDLSWRDLLFSRASARLRKRHA